MNELAAISVRKLSYSYPDGTKAITDISLDINYNECLGIIGPNGAGKSTLIQHFNGILNSNGNILVEGKQFSRKTSSEIRFKVGLIFQNPDDQLFCNTIFDDVAFGPKNMKLDTGTIEKRVIEALDNVGLSGFDQRNPFHLSIGEKRRASIATVLSMQPSIIVLDEPFAGLDPRGRREMISLLQKLDQTKIIVSHDLNAIEQLCSRIVVMDDGKIIADGVTENILSNADLLHTHGMI
jgi:cobalt/nickel transport system ATP-binding protein